MKSKFNWKKKTAIYIGRFQPFHDGHKSMFLKILKKDTQVVFLVMDAQNVGKKNPFNFRYVSNKIKSSLKDYKQKFIIIKIPVVSRVVYGRKVGYKINKLNLPKKIENISATLIRKDMGI
tara:strand:+ start:825 stop:1184 length:360 start_codon:yes stop_codon:yes gene_type:complete